MRWLDNGRLVTRILVSMAGGGGRYELVYSRSVLGHLKAIDRNFHAMIRRELEKQLQVEPLVETKNRKPLRRPVELGADWELRLGPQNRFRAFYRVEPQRREVWVLAIGEKVGNRLVVGGEEIEL